MTQRPEVLETIEFAMSPEENDKPRDECGVVGVWAPGLPVAGITYDALNGLQHRGESAAGIAVFTDPEGNIVHKGLGKVIDAIPHLRPDMDGMSILDKDTASPVAIGHVRYSTAASNSVKAAQPFVGNKSGIAISHNGDFGVLETVAARFDVDVSGKLSDSHGGSLLLDQRTAELGGDVVKAAREVLPHIDGAYCLIITDGNKLVGIRDPWGFHPLALGEFEDGEDFVGGYILASEKAVFDALGAVHVRDIQPGEIIEIDDTSIRSSFLDRSVPSRRCAYEFKYTARVDGEIDGVPVYDVRDTFGRYLYEDAGITASTIVVGMPDSGLAAAFGYAKASGLPLVQGVVKNPYSGRTFINRGNDRVRMLADKARPIRSQVEGERMVLVDDSMIKGNTMRANIDKFRRAGVARIDVVIASSPYMYPCVMGMDTGNTQELIARRMSIAEMRDYIGADSLTFLSPERVQQAVEEEAAKVKVDIGTLCMACSTGEYPFPVTDEVRRQVQQVSGNIALGMPRMRTVKLTKQ